VTVREGEPRLPREESQRFGFAEGDEWMANLLAATRAELGGSIGSYQLLEEVGRGGQGVVHRARQPGMQRNIAVKRLIAGGFASRAMRRRFEREVEAASTLQHPGIVTIYGMEVVDDVPVLAMEWIDGVPVNEWAKQSGAASDPSRLVRLFLRICDAVAHAHQRGVIHCDLKPSNILVDRNERPRILDFGLARFADGDRDDSVATEEAGFAGTRAYASPEQIRGDREALDVRTDVYSLGIVLYELLVGMRPDAGRASGANPPAAPLDFPRGAVGRELRSIVRQATAARRDERYASVADLAADLRRHLAGRPILAHPPGAFYVFSKFVGRHRVASALCAVLLITIVAFATVSTLQAKQLAIERDAEANARNAAEAAADAADSLYRFLVDDMLLAVEPKALGDDVSVGELLAVAASRAGERFATQPELEARVRSTLVATYDRLGRYQEAIREQRNYLALLAGESEPNASVLARAEFELALGLVKVEEFDAAIEIFRRLVGVFEKESPQARIWISRARREIGTCLESRGDQAGAKTEYLAGLSLLDPPAPEEFEEWAEHALALARIEMRTGDPAGAKTRLEELLEAHRGRQGDEHPKVAFVLLHLSDFDRARGDLDAARTKREEALRILERAVGTTHPWVASALGDLAAVLVRDEDLEAAEGMLRRAIDITERSRGEGTTAGNVHRMLLGLNLMRQRRFDDAAGLLEPVLRRFEAELGASATPALRIRKQLVDAWIHLGRGDDALALARRHLEALEASKEWASDPRERWHAFDRIQRAAYGVGRYEESLAALDRVLELTLDDRAITDEQKAKALGGALELYRKHGAPSQISRWEAELAKRSVVQPANAGGG
jgi:tetratricopeptide (TPR) repeat protein